MHQKNTTLARPHDLWKWLQFRLLGTKKWQATGVYSEVLRDSQTKSCRHLWRIIRPPNEIELYCTVRYKLTRGDSTYATNCAKEHTAWT